MTDHPEPDIPEEYRNNSYSVSVDFDGQNLVLQSSGNSVSTHDFSEEEYVPEGWGDEHPEWVRDIAVGLVESYFEEIWE